MRRLPGDAGELIERAQVRVDEHSAASRDGLHVSIAAAERICAARAIAARAAELRTAAVGIHDCASLLGHTAVAAIALGIRNILDQAAIDNSAVALIGLHVASVRLLIREERQNALDPATQVLLQGLEQAAAKLCRAELLTAA